MKEIHFYKDLRDFELENYGEFHEYHISHNSTQRAIRENEKFIYTTAISALNFSWLLENNYRIFLHENNRCTELREGVSELINKELHKEHNIEKIWIEGGFYDFFYNYD